MGVNAFIWMYMCSITVWLDVSPAHNIARPVGSTFPLLGQLGHKLLKVGRIIAGRSVPTHIIDTYPFSCWVCAVVLQIHLCTFGPLIGV